MTNATPTGSVCPLRRPPKGKDHPSASRTAFFGLPPDSRNPSSPQPSRLLDSPHHHADVGLADEKSGLACANGDPPSPGFGRATLATCGAVRATSPTNGTLPTSRTASRSEEHTSELQSL